MEESRQEGHMPMLLEVFVLTVIPVIVVGMCLTAIALLCP